MLRTGCISRIGLVFFLVVAACNNTPITCVSIQAKYVKVDFCILLCNVFNWLVVKKKTKHGPALQTGMEHSVWDVCGYTRCGYYTPCKYSLDLVSLTFWGVWIFFSVKADSVPGNCTEQYAMQWKCVAQSTFSLRGGGGGEFDQSHQT